MIQLIIIERGVRIMSQILVVKIKNIAVIILAVFVSSILLVQSAGSAFAASVSHSLPSALPSEHIIKKGKINETIRFGKNILEIKKLNSNSRLLSLTHNGTVSKAFVSSKPILVNGQTKYQVKIQNGAKKTIAHFTLKKNPLGKSFSKQVAKRPALVATHNLHAAIIAIIFGQYWFATGAVLTVIKQIEQLGWFGVVRSLYAEGFSTWEIAGLIISALPELGFWGTATVL